MSEQNQDKVEEKKDDTPIRETSQEPAEDTKVDGQDKETSDDAVRQDDGGETSKVDGVERDVPTEGEGGPSSQRVREKPSPLTLPTDLLNPHEADSLHPPDSPTTSLISSLRSQLSILSDQSIQLNQKLISSISKSADLEDELHELQSQHQDLTTRAGELEREKNKWEESMNTGLLVERSQIKDEMQKLAQGLVEEERRRGTAEEKRREVENEVDDLTAKLFDQANAMVATERMSRAEAEARLKSTEENLAAAEAAVRDMQLHLQSLPPSAVQPSATSLPPNTAAHGPASITITRKYLSSHIPYSEFLNFLQHLRTLRPIKEISKNTFPPPLITNLLTQPFLARTIIEDNDPTLRLDIAPDLSWLSRRSVSQAIVSGDLIVEPVSTSTLLGSTNSSIQDINCSLCGKAIFHQHQLQPQSPAGTSHFGPPPMHPQRSSNSTASRFSLKPFFATTTVNSSSGMNPTPNAPSPSQSPVSSPAIGPGGGVTSVYVFRIAKPQPQAGNGGDKGDSKLYPLCRTGWCLERMRATCELWHFVRTGVIHVIWHGDDGTSSIPVETHQAPVNPPTAAPETAVSSSTTEAPVIGEEGKVQVQPPPLPQRKKSSWALGFKLSEKSTGGWTRGWKSSGGTTNSPPGSPGTGVEKRRDSVGSLGAEKDENGRVQTAGGLGLGEALDIDEKKGEQEKDVPKIQEPSPAETEVEDVKKDEEDNTQEGGEKSPKSEGEEENNGNIQAPPLSRATSNISSINTSETGFHTPKGGQADLPSEDGHGGSPVDSEDEVKRDEQSTPHPPAPALINTDIAKKEGVIELASPGSGSGTASPTKAPPPIPRRAAARNRLSQLSGGTSTPVGSEPPTPVKSKSREQKDSSGDGEEDELSILRELRDELEQRKGEDVRGGGAENVDKDKDEEADGEAEVETINEGEKKDHSEEEKKDVQPESEGTETAKGNEVDDEEEEPFTPVNLDEKFPLSPLQQQTFPVRPASSSSGGGGGTGSRPNSQPPPPLPPRHPKTPVLQLSNSGGVDGEKRYFTINDGTGTENNSWENKTWEKIVRLKEEMWKARIGVVDE
ncbi:hypothetical protein I302_100384 [Kwoniella bestiolae CBS 10118]|uniref:GDP/GTP exchange factor Sec2 N-terminal domain-containing protein n=1 Tax=Kwoniella bestiolae CBS 10118 TaxID=1296100 RepID=A0A1B9G4Z5_9TREE|nr:hypothetical protein I302_03758 [Kwoniella bestiolae CBS 10118]OCF26081.1 hypothetical protein I302_03758 [Kwoniella bestiolae CBS 10118]